MEKILTVSIAAYNVENYIKENLESFISPEIMDDLEVLIVNDGGVDKTVEIAEEFSMKYPNTFKIINKENGGWGSTVNAGIKNASGKYFKLVDGDDKVVNIEKFIKILKNVDVDFVFTDYIKFYDDSDKIESVGNSCEVNLNEVLDISADYFPPDFAMHSCTFKTEILKKNVQITEKCFYTDVEFVLKSIINVKKVYFSDLEVYCYRIGRIGQSASVEGVRKHYKEHLNVLFGLLRIYNKLDDDSPAKEICKKRLIAMINSQYDIFLVLKPSFEHLKELSHFDKIIKKSYSEFYDCDVRKKIVVFRKLGVVSYPLILL